MDFEVTHTTRYAYSHPAAEAYVEARLTPRPDARQKILAHKLIVEPGAPISQYTDHCGNLVDFFSLPYRHQHLHVTNRLKVCTSPTILPKQNLEQTVQEARQIFASALSEVFEYLQPTALVPVGGEAVSWARKHLRSSAPLGPTLDQLNRAIHAEFRYIPGSTTHSTPLPDVWKQRSGVCQDFAHLMLSILRTAGIPGRYVCGYIETDPPKGKNGETLIGNVATHAWVEALLPGMEWVALDPTNRQWINEQYVAVSRGRDAMEAAPIRGTFKGSGGQTMKVQVIMKRAPRQPGSTESPDHSDPFPAPASR